VAVGVGGIQPCRNFQCYSVEGVGGAEEVERGWTVRDASAGVVGLPRSPCIAVAVAVEHYVLVVEWSVRY